MSAKPIHLNAFEMNCVSHLSHGMWVHPDNNRHRYTDLTYWTELAKLLEKGKFDALFLADVVGAYDTYKGGIETSLREAVQIPCNDPLLIVPPMAMVTEHLGFAVTFSTTYEHPYGHARRMSTLDHLTRGRVGWNVVTSYLPSAAKNYGLDRMVPHDERYERADEYMEVCYKLWESSWEEGAVIRDTASRVYTDPAKVHEIQHEGKYFRLPGPHLCEPSLQRTPVIYQAGSSVRGRAFAAKHAECVFLGAPSVEALKQFIADIRSQAQAFGRQPEHIKMFTGLSVIVGRTEGEVRSKVEEYTRLRSVEGVLAHYGGSSGYDLSKYGPDDFLEYIDTDHGQTAASRFTRHNRKNVGQIIETFKTLGGQSPFFIAGTPGQVADRIQQWVETTDLDGFNLTQFLSPGTFEDFIELVIPELQSRGLYRTDYEEGTFRERLFGKGSRLTPAGHPSAVIREQAFPLSVQN